LTRSQPPRISFPWRLTFLSRSICKFVGVKWYCPSKLKNGDKVKTPDTHPGEFQKNKDGSYTHTKSGWTFKKDKSNHGGEHYDIRPKNGKTGDYYNVYPDGTIR